MTERMTCALIRNGAKIIITTLWINMLVNYVLPLLWEVHKTVNVRGGSMNTIEKRAVKRFMMAAGGLARALEWRQGFTGDSRGGQRAQVTVDRREAEYEAAHATLYVLLDGFPEPHTAATLAQKIIEK